MAAEAEAAEKLRLAEEEAAARQQAGREAECTAAPDQDRQEAAERQCSAATAGSPQDAGIADGVGVSQQSSARQQRHPSVDAEQHAAAAHEAERRSREAGAGVNPVSAAASASANGHGMSHGRPGLAQHAQQQSHQPATQASHSGVSAAGADDARPSRAWSLDNGEYIAANGIPHPSRCAGFPVNSRNCSQDRR